MLRLSNIDPIIQLTADTLKIPKHVAEDVIMFQFKDLKEYIHSYPGPYYRIYGLGAFRLRYGLLYNRIKKLIKLARFDPTYDRSKITQLWKLRPIAEKEKKRRNYKERYGSWHFK